MSLYLQSIMDGERYLIPTGQVIEITPYVVPKRLPHSPAYIVGLLDYRGSSYPLIDVCQLMLERPSRELLCSRIVMGAHHHQQYGEMLIGWLFEDITDTVRVEESQFQDARIHLDDAAPYLGEIVNDQHGVMQRLRLDKLLPTEAYSILFPADAVEPQ